MEEIKNFTAKYHHISDVSLQAFNNLFERKEYAKNDILYGLNESSSKFFILIDGIARSEVINSSGKKTTRSLFTGPSVFTSLVSSLYSTPSKTEFNCLTDVVLYEGNFLDFIDLTNKHHDLAILYNRFLEEAFINMQRKATSLSTLDATERYLNLKSRIPNIEKLIKLNHIASYLNITSIQLSRIRKKLYSK